MTPEEKLAQLEQQIIELKAHIELQYNMHLEKQKDMEKLQEQKQQEVLQKQEHEFFKQKMIWLGSFTAFALAGIGAFIAIVKKLKEAKQELKDLIKK